MEVNCEKMMILRPSLSSSPPCRSGGRAWPTAVRRRVQLQQGRIATGLPHPEQSFEHHDVAHGKAAFCDGLANLARHRKPYRIVEIALQSFKLDGSTISLLGGSSVATSVLGRRSRNGLTRCANAAVRALSARFSMACATSAKGRLVAEKARVDEAQDRPEFAEMIFHRRAREAEAMLRLGLAQPSRGGSIGILDRLRLVQHGHMPIPRQQNFASRAISG